MGNIMIGWTQINIDCHVMRGKNVGEFFWFKTKMHLLSHISLIPNNPRKTQINEQNVKCCFKISSSPKKFLDSWVMATDDS